MAVSQRLFDPYQGGAEVYRAYRAGGRPAPQTTLVVTRTIQDGRTDGQLGDGRWVVRDFDAL
jgi:hypothetical protein